MTQQKRRASRSTSLSLAAACAGMISIFSLGAGAQTLPVPGDGTGTTTGTFADPYDVLTGVAPEDAQQLDAYYLDGVPIAIKEGDFYSYSGPLLQAMLDAGVIPTVYGEYDFAAGVGGLDMVVWTQAGGTDNQDIGLLGTTDAEDPGPTTGGSTTYVSGYWGQSDQNNDGTTESVNGPTTVGDVLGFIQQSNPENTIPVFGVDWNQSGAEDSLLASLQVLILDPTATCLALNGGSGCTEADAVESWSLDRFDNGVYDPNDPVLNFGPLAFYSTQAECDADPACLSYFPQTLSGNDYAGLQHNIGSGKADFFAFAPTMDLSLFNQDYIFMAHYTVGCSTGLGVDGLEGGLGCGTDGAEEGFIFGLASVGTTDVPEPGPLALFGVGLFCIGLLRKIGA